MTGNDDNLSEAMGGTRTTVSAAGKSEPGEEKARIHGHLRRPRGAMGAAEWNALTEQPGWQKFLRYLRTCRIQYMVLIAESGSGTDVERLRALRDETWRLEHIEYEAIRDIQDYGPLELCEFYGIDPKEYGIDVDRPPQRPAGADSDAVDKKEEDTDAAPYAGPA